jgi:WD40 repeat protein/lambda repressor-like predicted transcriptional regulator/ABC-type dipeptide/oligopeptide/nickel transport system ATPase component
MSQQRRRRGFLASNEGLEKLTARMLEKGYTQESLASTAGVSLSTLKKFLNPHWRRGIQKDSIISIARALELNPTEIVAPSEWNPVPTTSALEQSSLSAVVVEQLIMSQPVIPPCPYRGLSAFREEDAPFFFGREASIKKLVSAVRKKPLIAVIGHSGSGKSSVVFAGLIPKMRQEGGYLITSFSPKNRPFYRLAETLIPLLETQMSKTDQLVEIKKQADALQQGYLTLQDVVEAILQENSSVNRLLLVVDQFEELFTLCQTPQERQHFLDQLLATVQASSLRRMLDFTLVITLRADFLGQALSYRPFADALQHNHLIIGPMNRLELQEAIEKPAQKLDVQIEEGLTERILDAVIKEPGNLPLLEFALTKLWEKQSNRQMTHTAYEEIGGVEKALANHAEKVYKALNEEEQQRTQQVFVQLVHPGEGTEDSRRLATRTEVGEDNWDLVTRLADSRLVITGRDDATGEATVEIVHEALITRWERLRLWVKADREFRTWQERLRSAMQMWENSKRDEGALLRGALLVEAETWMEQRADALSSAEKEFIQASREHQEQEKQQERQLRKRAEISEIDALVSLSQAKFLLHDQLGALVASVKAGRKLQETEAPSDEMKRRTVDILRQVIYGIRERNRFEGHDDRVTSVSFSPDAQMIASSGGDKTVRLWRLDGTLLHTFHGHTDWVYGVSFSPDAKMLASGSFDKTVRLWRLDGTLLKTFHGHSGMVNKVSFSPDAQMIASASDDKTVKLWRLDGTLVQTFHGHSDRVWDVSFSLDSQMLASASVDKTVRLWRLDGTLMQTFEGHSDNVQNLSFSLDSQMLASASDDKTVRLWQLDGTLVQTFHGHNDRVTSVSFSPDCQTIASASTDKTVKLWRLDGTLLQTFYGHSDRVWSVSFSPDGQMLASASDDKTVRLWQLEGTESFQGHSDRVWSVSFSPDGQMLASASDDKTVRLWRLDGTLVQTFHGHSDRVASMSFSPDGQMLASASDDKTVRLWRLDGTLVQTFHGHSDRVTSVSFSPDGQMLASASDDKTVRLWRLDGTLVQTFHEHDRVYGVSFSPSGQMLASASDDKTVRLWRLDGTLVQTFPGHSDRVTSVSFNPDGQMLASASDDKTVKLWQLDGTLVKTFQGHDDRVWGVSFSPDSQMLASASFDRTVRLWHSNGILLRTFYGHSDGVWCVSFSPDGQTIASASWDKTVRLWQLDGTEGILDIDAQLDNLLVRGCIWLRDYLKTNLNVSESNHNLCDGIRIQK